MADSMHPTWKEQTDRIDDNGTVILEKTAKVLEDHVLTRCTEEGVLQDHEKMSLLDITNKMKRCSELKDLLRAGSGVRFRKFQNILIEIGKPDVAELLDCQKVTQDVKGKRIKDNMQALLDALVPILDDELFAQCEQKGILLKSQWKTIQKILNPADQAQEFLEHLKKTSVDSVLSFSELMRKENQREIADMLEGVTLAVFAAEYDEHATSAFWEGTRHGSRPVGRVAPQQHTTANAPLEEYATSASGEGAEHESRTVGRVAPQQNTAANAPVEARGPRWRP